MRNHLIKLLQLSNTDETSISSHDFLARIDIINQLIDYLKNATGMKL